MLKIDKLPYNLLSKILDYAANFQFSYVNKTFKNQNALTISQASNKIFEYIKNTNLHNVFLTLLNKHNETDNEGKVRIFKQVLYYIHSIHKIVDKDSFLEIQILHEKSSFDEDTIKKIIDRINNFASTTKEVQFFEKIGDIYFDLKQYNKALDWYEKTIQFSKKREKAIYYKKKATVFLFLKEQEKELECFFLAAKNFYLANEKKEAIKIYTSIVDFYEKNPDKKSSILGEVFNELGLIYQKSNDINKAKNYFEKASQIFENFNQEKKAFCYKDIALLCLKNCSGIINNFTKTFTKEKALNYYEKAYSIFNNENNIQEKFDCQLKIGNVLQKLNKYEEALAKYKKAYTNLLRIKYDNKEMMLSKCCVNIARIFLKTGDKKAAPIFFKNSLKYLKEEKKIDTFCNLIKDNYQNTKHEKTKIFAEIYENIGSTYFKLLKYEKAANFYEKAGDIFYDLEKKEKAGCIYIKTINSLFHVITTTTSITLKEKSQRKRGKLLAKCGDIDFELNKKNAAIKKYLMAADKLVEIKNCIGYSFPSKIRADYSLINDLYKKTAKIYQEQGNNKEALKIYAKLQKIKDSFSEECTIF
ncbi:MAG: hypothetical protein AMS24_03610 [Chlamydiae bacterium SM23_39]|nr:MAG: hypothetical protein AMS24_03610 [Chlamydiae bacterium SM23_39]